MQEKKERGFYIEINPKYLLVKKDNILSYVNLKNKTINSEDIGNPDSRWNKNIRRHWKNREKAKVKILPITLKIDTIIYKIRKPKKKDILPKESKSQIKINKKKKNTYRHTVGIK